jgi:peptide/nickel transport system substrate-binding protein
MSKKTLGRLTAVVLILALGLVACQPQVVEVPVEVTRVVTETVVEEGETVEVTRIVTEVEEVEVTPVPEEAEAIPVVAPEPGVYREITFGDIDTLDPSLGYDTASNNIIDNVMESLIYYNYTDATTFVPVLALEVPSVENGLVSEDGSTYTFNIRPGVNFHDGGTLEPHDVAYTFQRGLLQSDPNGPQWLFIEPIMGYSATYDITEEIAEGAYAGDPEGLIANATPEELLAVCEKVKAAVVADDDAGTVTFNLAQPWAPFLATIAGTWGSIMDMEWAIEQGAWDGTCETWQNHYAPGAENTELGAVINGTGPFMLDHWTPGEETVLTRFDGYWRETDSTPLWEGGPSGPAQLDTVIISLVDEWGTRFAALQAGDAEWVSVPSENETQVDPLVAETCDWATNECTATENEGGFLRKWDFLPRPARDNVFLNFDVGADNPYTGSGQLDGNGIPSDFFSDINVRLAMNTCFDYETYIAEVQNGKAVRNNGPIIRDMLGYNEDGPQYEYDPEACAAYLEQAWDGALPETGFRFQIAFNTGNTSRQTVGEMYQAEFSAINPLYQVETVGLPWPTFLRSFRDAQLPVAVSGWVEDIHDPHNWVQPFTVGTYAGRQNLPQEFLDQFNELVTAGVLATSTEEREAIYFELQQLFYDSAIQVVLPQPTIFRFEQPWVNGYYFQPAAPGRKYYAYSLTSE